MGLIFARIKQLLNVIIGCYYSLGILPCLFIELLEGQEVLPVIFIFLIWIWKNLLFGNIIL